MPATPSAFETTPTFADLTTIRIGGPIDEFVRPETRDEVIDTVRRADAQGTRLCIIGGGSNMLVSDAPFHGVVVRDMRDGIRVSRSAPDDSGDVIVEADAGANWDDFVAWTVSEGYEGIEGLSGIPGSVGASVVQNIGAYGQEVASSVLSVTAWDRQAGAIVEIGHDNLAFGYRFSALKATMYETPEVQGTGEGRRETRWFPSPRYVVLAVTYRFRRSRQGTVGMGQLAKALGVEKGTRMDLTDIRAAVLSIRATKDMLEDPTRYANPWMTGTKVRFQRRASPITTAGAAEASSSTPWSRPSMRAGISTARLSIPACCPTALPVSRPPPPGSSTTPDSTRASDFPALRRIPPMARSRAPRA